MNCIDCRYSLLKDGHYNCTYEEGECIKISVLEKENAELERKLEQTEKDLADYQFNYPTIKELQKENAELKAKLGLSIECDKAQKDGELCLGYGGYEEEPCEQCKNCIKCECGYYQLGETEKDDQLTKAKAIIRKLLRVTYGEGWNYSLGVKAMAEQFLKDVSE